MKKIKYIGSLLILLFLVSTVAGEEYVVVTIDPGTQVSDLQVHLYDGSLSLTDEMFSSIDINAMKFTGMDGETTYSHKVELPWISKDDYSVYVNIADIGTTQFRWYLNNGNSGSGSDTFIEFFDGDQSFWTEVDPNGHIDFANGRLEFHDLSRNENAYVYKSYSEPSPDNIIIEHTFVLTENPIKGCAVAGVLGDEISGFGTLNNGVASHELYSYHGVADAVTIKRVNDVITESNGCEIELNTQYWVRNYQDDESTTIIYSDPDRENVVSQCSLDISDVPDMNYIYLISSWNDGKGFRLSGWLDDFRVRKYVEQEPEVISYSGIRNETLGSQSLFFLQR